MTEGWTIPGFPLGCVHHGKIVIQEGTVPSCIVLRQIEGLMPYVTYKAVLRDGQWSYIDGHYFKAEEYEKAVDDFTERDREP